MDAIPPAPQPPKKNKEILLEIVFVLVLLIILLGTLNYFNIIKLSQIFPNQLGWLPHKSVDQLSNETMKQPDNSSISPSDTIPTDQTYNILSSFITPIITSLLAPNASSEINLTQETPGQNDFIAAWEAEAGKVEIKYSINPEGNQISSIQISLETNQNATVSESSTEELTSQYFLPIPKSSFVCTSPDNNLNYCESFWEESDGTKRGVGTNENSVFFCQFTNESQSYSWKSCSPKFSATGVQ